MFSLKKINDRDQEKQLSKVNDALKRLDSVVTRYETTPYQGCVNTTKNFFLLAMQETDSVLLSLKLWLESSPNETLFREKTEIFKSHFTRFKAATSHAYATISNSNEPDKEMLMDYAVKVTQTVFRAFRLVSDLLTTEETDRVSKLDALLTAGTQLRIHQIAVNLAAERLAGQSNTTLLTALEDGKTPAQPSITKLFGLLTMAGDSNEGKTHHEEGLVLKQTTELQVNQQRLIKCTQKDLHVATAQVSDTRQSLFSAQGNFDFSITKLRFTVKRYLESSAKHEAGVIRNFANLVKTDLIHIVGELEAYTTFTTSQTDIFRCKVIDYVQNFLDEVSQHKEQLAGRIHQDENFHTEIYELTVILSKLTGKINSFAEAKMPVITDDIATSNLELSKK